jgi:hypothetical protein
MSNATTATKQMVTVVKMIAHLRRLLLHAVTARLMPVSNVTTAILQTTTAAVQPVRMRSAVTVSSRQMSNATTATKQMVTVVKMIAHLRRLLLHAVTERLMKERNATTAIW